MKKMNFTLKALFGKAALMILLSAFTGSLRSQCTAGFTYTINSNGQVDFTSTSTSAGPISNYSWSFGDGNWGSGSTISHTYFGTGWRHVTHSIGDSTSCYASVPDSIYVDNSNCNAVCSYTLVEDSLNPGTYSAYTTYPANMISNSWSWGDGSTSTGLSPSHTYTSGGTSLPGAYIICLYVKIACGDSASSCLIVPNNYRSSGTAQHAPIKTLNVVNKTSIATAIKTNKNTGIGGASVYPNPAADKASLSIYSETAGSYKAELYDVTGRVLTTELINAEPGNTTTSFNTSALNPGLYFISLSNGSQHSTLRLIKE